MINLPDDFNDDAEQVEVEGIVFELFSLGNADRDDKDAEVGELRQNRALEQSDPLALLVTTLCAGALFEWKPCRVWRQIPAWKQEEAEREITREDKSAKTIAGARVPVVIFSFLPSAVSCFFTYINIKGKHFTSFQKKSAKTSKFVKHLPCENFYTSSLLSLNSKVRFSR